MEIPTLGTHNRSDTAANKLRKQDIIPAVFYGHGEKTHNLEIDASEFKKLFRVVGRSSIINLKIGEELKTALVHDVSYHPVNSSIQSIDFYAVNMKEEITAEIPIKTINISLAVKDLGGMLTTPKNTVGIKCLPAHLPHDIEVDISVMKELGDSIHIKDLPVIDQVVFTDDPEDVVVSVAAPRKVQEETTEAPEDQETTTVADEKQAERDEKKGEGDAKDDKKEEKKDEKKDDK